MLIFGYGNTPLEKMEAGIELLAELVYGKSNTDRYGLV